MPEMKLSHIIEELVSSAQMSESPAGWGLCQFFVHTLQWHHYQTKKSPTLHRKINEVGCQLRDPLFMTMKAQHTQQKWVLQ